MAALLLAIYTNGRQPRRTASSRRRSSPALVNAGLWLDRRVIQTGSCNLKGGLSTMDRLRARALESLVLVQAMVGTVTKDAGTCDISFGNDGWIHQLGELTPARAAHDAAGSTWTDKSIPVGTVQGWGATEAPRGALMHQCTITNGKIVAYQCIVPTTWNGSPKDAAGNNGAIEEAMIGAAFNQTPANYVGAGSTATTSTPSSVALRSCVSPSPSTRASRARSTRKDGGE